MGKEILMFGHIKIEKQIFIFIKALFCIEDVDTDNVLMSNKIYSCNKSYKHFIGLNLQLGFCS